MTATLTDVKFPVPLPGTSSRLETYLRRFGNAPRGAPAVVLLHGGNTSGDTFLVPRGGLVAFLVERGFDVWVLEWRGSPYVVKPLLDEEPLGGSVLAECRLFTLDRVIEDELTVALQIVRSKIEEAELSVLGHCLGSAVVSMAAARGVLEHSRVANLVLSTLGLFVEVPWTGWIKAEDFLLERVLHNDRTCRAINPRRRCLWPEDVGTAMQRWPTAWLPGGTLPHQRLLRVLSFMLGQPYSIDRLHPSLRGNSVAQYFGPMHMGLYLHASQMVRRGFAARFDDPDIVDRSRLHRRSWSDSFAGDLASEHFANKRVTLLAAGANHLWHRESVDLMYDWLRSARSASSRVSKVVFSGYNLQELLWGERAEREVFPAIWCALTSQETQTTGRVAVSV